MKNDDSERGLAVGANPDGHVDFRVLDRLQDKLGLVARRAIHSDPR